ncbi:hypothetical protein GCM10023195_54260 [Actinoallomurus liliacearum]|uniref:Uncharacterized protein n=1 Tax=Actinoallomurus liliacearum TaxID=1080073 RepID=A0ABP8TR72_9ACTN
MQEAIYSDGQGGHVERDVQLVKDFVAAVPGFEDLYDAHVFNEGGVLSIVFFWEVVRETVSSFLGGDETDWRVTLRFLEEQLRLDVREVNQVVASFLFYLPWPHQPGYGLVDHLGPSMRAKFATIRPAG